MPKLICEFCKEEEKKNTNDVLGFISQTTSDMLVTNIHDCEIEAGDQEPECSHHSHGDCN